MKIFARPAIVGLKMGTDHPVPYRLLESMIRIRVLWTGRSVPIFVPWPAPGCGQGSLSPFSRCSWLLFLVDLASFHVTGDALAKALLLVFRDRAARFGGNPHH